MNDKSQSSNDMERITSHDDVQPNTPLTNTVMAVRLWREYLYKYWVAILIAFGFMLLLAFAEASISLATQWIFLAFENEGRSSTDLKSGEAALTFLLGAPTPERAAIIGPILLFVLGMINAIAMFFQVKISQGTGLRVLRDLQKKMFSQFLVFDLAQSREDGSGQLVSRFTNDTLVLRESFTRAPNALRDILRVVIFIATLVFIDWALFLVVLLVYPTVGLPLGYIGKYIRRIAKRIQEQIGDMTSSLSQSMRGATMVKIYGLENYEENVAHDSFDARQKMLDRLATYRAMNNALILVVAAIAISIVVALAAYRIKIGAMNGSDLVAFLVALAMLSQPARSLGTINAVLQEGFSSLERLFWVIDRAPQITDQQDATPLAMESTNDNKIQKGAHLKFHNVTFGYDDTNPILQNFDLDIQPGQMVAFVGESGAGKSTIFNLLPRLYDYQSGSVTINGQDIKQVTMESLRQSMAYVSQEAILFDDTIRTNIAFGHQNATYDAIQAAAKAAAADEFINRFPDAYDSMVGEGGNNLSGGQRQRIALARAFLKDAPILLLDEATSALDADSEAKVQAAIERLTVGRTTLVIAHRLSTIRHADVICVMENGQIVEKGSHDELLALGQKYAALTKLQMN